MDFSDKLTKLLALTETQNAELGKAILLDSSQISRMKTGARGRPRNPDTLHRMSDYFASRCTSDYRIFALAELTDDRRIRTNRSELFIAEVIFDWLSKDDNISASPRLGAFLKKIEDFSLPDETDKDKIESLTPETHNSGCYAYFDNAGKRAAVKKLIDIIAESPTPRVVYLFTDESIDWIIEDPEYVQLLAGNLSKLAKKGCQFHRVEPPTLRLDSTILSIERWLTAYMLGSMRDYYYSKLRDDLHRRTIFLVPDLVAVVSESIAGRNNSRLCMLYTDPQIVNIYRQDVEDIVRLCKPVMRAYSEVDSEEMFASLGRMASIEADGIYKTSSLSIASMPDQILERICKENGAPMATKMLKSKIHRSELREHILKNYTINDIMTPPDLQDVLNGKAIIPSSKVIPNCVAYYTPQEYCLHLQNILDLMEQYPNYNAILTDTVYWKDLILYSKGDDNVLLVKDTDPFTVFEFADSPMTAGFCGYLRQIYAKEQLNTTRQNTMRVLRDMISKIKAH